MPMTAEERYKQVFVDPFEALKAENRELRKRGDDLFDKYCDLTFALGLVTGHFPPFNEKTQERAEACLAKRKAEWFEKHPELKPI